LRYPAACAMVAPMTPDPRTFTHFGFAPLAGFSMIAFANAVEVLRMAVYLGCGAPYRWSVLSAEGGDVTASNGLRIPSRRLDPDDVPDIVFVCGGTEVEAATGEDTLAWLRALAARGVALGSLCTGAHALAAAGLLDGYRCTIHWENAAALSTAFPQVAFSDELFVIDRDRYTCSGGVAPLDMMLHIAAARLGGAAVARIAGQFVHELVREPGHRQTVPPAARLADAQPALLEVVQLMEANVAEPLALDDLARLTGASPRQLQRMFGKQLGMPPLRYYLELRLHKARELLRETALPLAHIGAACGFQSVASFSKAYREVFGASPGTERRARPG
jgi:AraC family transcriptional regulator, glycine betaine-responsive activator